MGKNKEAREMLEFHLPGLRSADRPLPKRPYAYVLTTDKDVYIRTYPTLCHVAARFSLSSCTESPEKYLIRAVWADNRAYFVPNELIFAETGEILPPGEVLEHFLERNLEDYLVQNYWENEARKAKRLPEQRSAAPNSKYNYMYPPEYIPKTGWVDENHPLHSANANAKKG